jgi:hypothetical protein
LRHIAGEFAPRIAGLWPEPHAAFLTAPAERRHLVCLALALVRDKPLPVSGETLLCASLRDAIQRSVPAAPNGLGRALAHLGESAWASSEYLALLALLASPLAGKSLRHAKAIRPELVTALHALPETLIRAGVGQRFALGVDQARLLAETWAVLEQARPEEARNAEALRWGGARSSKALFELVRDSLVPELPAPPFPGSARLVALDTKARVREAAGRYRNCLRTLVGQAVDGEAAFYEWIGPPGVVVQLWRDRLFGWRLEQARLANNDVPARPVRDAINAELRSWGVHVGRSCWQLENATEQAQNDWYRYWPVEEAIDDFYGD